MTRTSEYAIRFRRYGGHEQVRFFQTRYYAERYARWITERHGDALAELRIERRAVGPWQTIEQVTP